MTPRAIAILLTVPVALYAPLRLQVALYAVFVTLLLITASVRVVHRITHPRPRRHCCR